MKRVEMTLGELVAFINSNDDCEFMICVEWPEVLYGGKK